MAESWQNVKEKEVGGADENLNFDKDKWKVNVLCLLAQIM